MVKRVGREDADTVASLAVCMWGDHTVEELADEFKELIDGREAAVFLKYVQDVAIGFAQCQLRHDYVEGTDSSPVGYLEGIFVREEFRRRGYAGELLEACEGWAKECGCTEFASDCELDNEDSFGFHMKMGFEEANRIICFTKEL